MNRRSFLGLGFKGALLGAAISVGLSVTKITTVNEYSVLYRFTDKTADLYGDDTLTPIKEQAFERVGLIAHERRGKIVGYKTIHVPVGQIKDKSDPLGQVGYFGINFHLEEAS